MRALTLVADRQLVVADTPPPPPPGAGEVQIRVKAVALNHIDVWGYRGMAFAKRKTPARGRRGSLRRDCSHRRWRNPLQAGTESRDVRRADLRHLSRMSGWPRQPLRKCCRYHGFPCRRLRPRIDEPQRAAGDPGAGRASQTVTRPARRSHSRPFSTCCSTTPNCCPAKPCWCMPAARVLAPSRS